MSEKTKSLPFESPGPRGQGKQDTIFQFQNANPISKSLATPSEGSEGFTAFFPGWLNSLFDQEEE